MYDGLPDFYSAPFLLFTFFNLVLLIAWQLLDHLWIRVICFFAEFLVPIHFLKDSKLHFLIFLVLQFQFMFLLILANFLQNQLWLETVIAFVLSTGFLVLRFIKLIVFFYGLESLQEIMWLLFFIFFALLSLVFLVSNNLLWSWLIILRRFFRLQPFGFLCFLFSTTF